MYVDTGAKGLYHMCTIFKLVIVPEFTMNETNYSSGDMLLTNLIRLYMEMKVKNNVDIFKILSPNYFVVRYHNAFPSYVRRKVMGWLELLLLLFLFVLRHLSEIVIF